MAAKKIAPPAKKIALTIPELIEKKRDGGKLSDDDLKQFVSATVSGEMQDCQIGAMLMAIYLRGLDMSETATLTRHMTRSGEVMAWPADWQHLVADKHSTGGVGDKTSLSLVPALAACGLKVPKISGRGLGSTGGTVDKLESIPGYKIEQSMAHIIRIVTDVGCCIVGQTKLLVPADKILYSIRDVTATVNSIPLIGASIISKKAAESLTALVLDVKFGCGAVCKEREVARELAMTLVRLSEGVGIRTTALLTDMDNVIGRTVGNALEVAEALDCLRGVGPAALRETVTALGGHLLVNAGQAANVDEGTRRVAEALKNGEAMKKFSAMMAAQGVSAANVTKLTGSHEDATSVLPKAKFTRDIKSLHTGYVSAINASACADVSLKLGGGRTKASDNVDHAVGLQLYVDVGSRLNRSDRWMTVHYSKEPLPDEYVTLLQNALSVNPKEPKAKSHVAEAITANDQEGLVVTNGTV